MMHDFDDLEFKRTRSDRSLLRTLLTYLKPHWGKFIGGIILMLLSLAIDLLPNYFIGKSVDILEDPIMANSNKSTMILIFVGILVAILVAAGSY